MKNRLKIVVDTNIFIDGLLSFEEENNKYCVKIINMINSKQFYLLFSQDTIGELVYVAKNFARHNISNIYDRVSLLQYLIELFYFSKSVNTSHTISPEINDKYDDMFLKCAIEGQADYLISDDFKSGMHSIDELGFKVMNARGFCKMIESDIISSVGAG